MEGLHSRAWNEPRRKRLNFLRNHPRDPDDWMMTSPYPSRRLTERDLWDRQRVRETEQKMSMNPPPRSESVARLYLPGENVAAIGVREVRVVQSPNGEANLEFGNEFWRVYWGLVDKEGGIAAPPPSPQAESSGSVPPAKANGFS